MSDWVVIFSFTYPHEAYVAKGLLESNGIEVLLKDEMTTQVYNFYSNAIGGVKIQVKKSDVEGAKKILKEGGYFEETLDEPYKFVVKIDELTAKIPIIGKQFLIARMMILITVILSSAFIVGYIVTIPTTEELLVDENWKVEEVIYDGKSYEPVTFGLQLTHYVKGNVVFMESGRVNLPGFNTEYIYANWKWYGDYIVISDATDFGFVYNGTYSVDVDKKYLLLESEKTEIIGFK